MRIFTLIRRTAPGGGDGPGEVDARFIAKPAVRFSTVAEALAARTRAGFAAVLAPIAAVAAQRAGLDLLPSASGSPAAPAKPALRLAGRGFGSNREAQKPAANVVETTVALNGVYGADAANSSGVAWSNPANATGRANGTVASRSGQVAVVTQSALDLQYPSFVGKGALAISSVRLKLYWRLAGTVLGNGSASAWATVDGGLNWTQLGGTHNNDFDALATPEEFDVTSLIGGVWSKLELLLVEFSLTIPVGQVAQTVSVDAAECLITAARTEVN